MSKYTLKSRFEQLDGERGDQKDRWEEYAGWTQPAVFPDEEDVSSKNDEYQGDYQSLGAQALNHLTNKIMMTLFPPARPFFRLELTQEQSAELEAAGLTKEQVETLTGKVEQQSMKEMDKIALRTAATLAIKSLITTGNSLMYNPKNGKAQTYNLKDYVVTRDPSGMVIELVMKDRKVCRTLPEEVKDAAYIAQLKDDDEVTLYTGIRLMKDGKYYVNQEVDELGAVGTSGSFSKEDLPWLALTWELPRGYDYAVGLVEQLSGDFAAYSKICESMLTLVALASDIKFLVRPDSQTDVQSLNEAETGARTSTVMKKT